MARYCEAIYDEDGVLLASVQRDSRAKPLTDEQKAAEVAALKAFRDFLANQPPDPEREARQAAGMERIRARNERLGL